MAERKTGAAAAKKAAAAQAESNGKVDPIMFHGLELKLKPKLPLSIPMRIGVLRDDDVMGAFRIIESMVGRDQYQLLVDKVDEEGLDTDSEAGMTEIGELLNQALENYGLTQGEAQASDSS